MSSNETLAVALDRATALYGEREAVADGDTRWSYRELEAKVSAFDRGLDDLGCQAGDVVGVLALNSAAHLVAWLAIPRSGRVLNDLNVRLAPAELEFILNDSSTKVLLVDDAHRAIGEQLEQLCPGIKHVVHLGATEAPAGWRSFAELTGGPGRPAAAVDPDAVAGIFYTGGTTGLPKGAMLTHCNLVANAKHALILLRYDEADSYLHAAPMFHLANGASVFALTWVGGRHVVIPSFDPGLWLATVAQEAVTRALLVPTMINMVVNHPAAGDTDLSSLRSVVYGGSPIPTAVLTAAMRLLDADFSQAYGMTEASPLVSSLSPEDHRRGAAGEEPFAGRLRSAGRPIVGVDAQVFGPGGERCGDGEIGEVWVRGDNIMAGYWKREEETASALDAEGWYHTGDAAYRDADGYLFIVDRVKDMMISGGENVYSTEVENAISSHDAVLECAVFGVPDERWGERVHAAIVGKPGAQIDEDMIVAHLRERIAGYKLPRSIDFHDEPLPKSGAGKLLKRVLREPFWSGRERQVS
ncbi:Long-chain-fatty-acid--CoA ligase [Paraconexibacter sp. AEG42_29]|uniref:Long-chain-fatty-acid--CoA ligase n=1 Tax=Paraconexibacter sp. AEG42_29 TaxID=2997339 RepID=A0AAU7AZA8_9ACTN